MTTTLINQYTVIRPGQNINYSDSEAFGTLHTKKDNPGIYFDLTTLGGWKQYWGHEIRFSWIPTRNELNKVLVSVIKLTKNQYEELINQNQKTSIEFPFIINSELLWEQKQDNEKPTYYFEDEAEDENEEEEIEENLKVTLDWGDDSYQDN